jgi:hypothetical protein
MKIMIRYGKSVFDTKVINLGAIRYLPRKIKLLCEIKWLEMRRDRLMRSR